MLVENPSTYEPPKKPLTKYVVFGLIAFLLLVVINWAWSVSFVEVAVTNPGSGEMTFQFVNQKTGKTSEEKSTKSTFKKRVSRANYSVYVKQNDTSYFASVDTPGFFGSSTVSAKLIKEKERSFIGDNPSGCMAYLGSVLTSYDCSSAIEKIKIHVPASSSQPTYTQTTSNPSELEGYVEGFIKTGEGNLLFLHSHTDGDLGDLHFVYRVDSNMKVIDYKRLDTLKGNSTYSIKPYKEGFLAYSTDLKEAFYFQTFSSSPNKIPLGSNKNKALAPSILEISGGSLISTYTDSEGRGGSEVIVSNGSRSYNYSLKSVVTSATLCGAQLLCAVDNTGLSVYRLEGENLDKIYGIRDAVKVIGAGNNTLVITTEGVLNLNASQQSGYLIYSFGDYKFNNIELIDKGYLLAVTSPSGNKRALLIDQSTDNIDSIDKKIIGLEKLSEIDSISPYRQIVFISPDLGELVYNSALGEYDYDPSIKKSVNTKINQTINSLGIDRSRYQVINAAGQ